MKIGRSSSMIDASEPVDPDQGWNTLRLVTDWIKHAETKAAGSLAAAGIVGGVLYNLVKNETHPGFWLGLFAVVCTAGVFATGICAIGALWPRLNAKDEPTSGLYFDHIARQHPSKETYLDTLRLLMADNEHLIKELANQVWSTAHVARQKYLWAIWATRSFVLALSGLAATTLLLGWRSISKG